MKYLLFLLATLALLLIFRMLSKMFSSVGHNERYQKKFDKSLYSNLSKSRNELINRARIFERSAINCSDTLFSCQKNSDCESCSNRNPTFSCDNELKVCVPDDGVQSDQPKKSLCNPKVAVFPVYKLSRSLDEKLWSCLSLYPEVYDTDGEVQAHICGNDKGRGTFVPEFTESSIVNPYVRSSCRCNAPYKAVKLPNELPICTVNPEFYKEYSE